MNQPTYLHLHRAGLRSLAEAALLWHLAECGVTGSTTPQITAALRLNYNTTHCMLDRLQELRLIAKPQRMAGKQGTPNLWILSRLGYRLITGQALAIDEHFAPVTAAS